MKKDIKKVEGIDKNHIIFFIPIGTPEANVAINNAIDSVPGAVALVDGVIHHNVFYIPYFYGQIWYSVEGTPLIDTSLLSKQEKDKFINKIDRYNNNSLSTKKNTSSEISSLSWGTGWRTTFGILPYPYIEGIVENSRFAMRASLGPIIYVWGKASIELAYKKFLKEDVHLFVSAGIENISIAYVAEAYSFGFDIQNLSIINWFYDKSKIKRSHLRL